MDPMKARIMIAGAALLAAAVIAGVARGAEKKVTMDQLPAAVQQTVKERSQGGTIRGLSMEQKNGQTIYEAELTLSGRNVDLSIDEQGKVVEFEGEIALDRLPAAARDAIQQQAAGGTIGIVEEVTEKGKTMYEAHVTKAGKQVEIKVDPQGHTVR